MKTTLVIKIALAGAALGYFTHQCVLESREQKLAQDNKFADRYAIMNRLSDAAEAAIQERIDGGDLKNAASWQVERAYNEEFDRLKNITGI